MIPVKHPDTIPGLAPDCRRVLRDDYIAIQVATTCGRTPKADRPARVAAAIAEYRRTAALWGVDVG